MTLAVVDYGFFWPRFQHGRNGADDKRLSRPNDSGGNNPLKSLMAKDVLIDKIGNPTVASCQRFRHSYTVDIDIHNWNYLNQIRAIGHLLSPSLWLNNQLYRGSL